MQYLIMHFFVRLLLCIGFAYLAWQQADAIGLIFASLIFGVALAKPLLELISYLRLLIKQSVFANAQGRHYVFQTTAIDILRDEHQQIWLRLSDVRRVIKRFPKDAVVIRLYPNDVMYDKQIRSSRIDARALVDYLQRSKNSTALTFMHWIEREVIFPTTKATH